MRKLLLLFCFGLLTALGWGQSTTSGSLTAAGSTCTSTAICVTLPLSPAAGAVGLSVTGTWSATLQFEGSSDNGASFVAISGFPLNSTTGASNTTSNGTWRFAVSGLTHIRVRCSAFTSGSAAIAINSSSTAASLNQGGGGGGGSGTVTDFTAGDLSPIFTTSVATSSSTPALTFSLTAAGANTVLGNNTGSSAAPAYVKVNLAAMVTGTLPVANGGTGTTTPALVAGTNVTITGTWPNQTINSSGGGGGATSVALAGPTGFGISGSPVTTTGTLTFAMPTSWTTGDLLLGNGSNSVARLGIGSNGACLTSNGTTAAWGSCAAGSIGGSGTANTLPKFTASTTLADSLLADDGTTLTYTGTGGMTVSGTTAILPSTAAGGDIGSATLPFQYLWFAGSSGTPGTNNFKLIGASTSGTRTATFPNANTLIPIATQTLTFAGPTAARTITFPDAAITVARTDAANTFTGVQTMTSPVLVTPNLGIPSAIDLTNATSNKMPGAAIKNAEVTATQLAAQYSKGSCTEVWGGSGTSFAMTSGDDAIVNNACYNDSGVTRTITAVKCRSDNAGNTTTVNPTFGSAGTGTSILSGALTCGNSYAYSSSGTVSNSSWTTGTGVSPGMATAGNATSIAMIVEYTF